MIPYKEFVRLAASSNSQHRGMAAHLAANAYVRHIGPADENAALYAALIGFLDDSSVKVRAALAYGLLHSDAAPRPVMLALMSDAPVIARAVVQYSPVIIEPDILPLIGEADEQTLLAIGARNNLTPRLAAAIIGRQIRPAALAVLGRHDVRLADAFLSELALERGTDPGIRGALFARPDLPADARMILIGLVRSALTARSIVSRAIPAKRLERVLRDACDKAYVRIVDGEPDSMRGALVQAMGDTDQISTRVLLHALVHGHTRFFAQSIAALAEMPMTKVFAIVGKANRGALMALLRRAGMSPSLAQLTVRLILMARQVDLTDDQAARHYVVTAMLDDLTHDDSDLTDEGVQAAFAYLGEQNIVLAKGAARGAMAGFASGPSARNVLPALDPAILALPSANAA